MAGPSWDDLDAFLRADDFAQEVVVTPQGGDSRSILAIFDEPYLNAELGEYDLDTAQPRLSAKSADLDGLDRGDTATIGGVVYDVLSRPQHDGTGMAILPLAAR